MVFQVYIKGISDSDHTNIVNFRITANDTLGNEDFQIVTFIVDNKNPDITFNFPDGHYVIHDKSHYLEILIS
jgi:hypothetical protein